MEKEKDSEVRNHTGETLSDPTAKKAGSEELLASELISQLRQNLSENDSEKDAIHREMDTLDEEDASQDIAMPERALPEMGEDDISSLDLEALMKRYLPESEQRFSKPREFQEESVSEETYADNDAGDEDVFNPADIDADIGAGVDEVDPEDAPDHEDLTDAADNEVSYADQETEEDDAFDEQPYDDYFDDPRLMEDNPEIYDEESNDEDTAGFDDVRPDDNSIPDEELYTEEKVRETTPKKHHGLLGLFRRKGNEPEDLASNASDDGMADETPSYSDEIYDSYDNSIVPEAQVNSSDESDAASDGNGDFDETDAKLMVAFGMDDKLAETVGFDRVSEIEEGIDQLTQQAEAQVQSQEAPAFEYVSKDQNKEIFAKYKRSYISVLLRLLGGAILAIAAFFFENLGVFGGSLPDAVNASVFPTVHVMVSLQLLVLACALVWRQLLSGIKSLFALKPSPESVLSVLVLLTLVYHGLVYFTGMGNAVRMYNFPIILCILLVLAYEYMNMKREIFCFNVVASKKVKYYVEKLDEENSQLEREVFDEYLPKDPMMFRIGKANFIDGFYRRMHGTGRSVSTVAAIIPVVLVAAVVFMVLGLLFTRSLYTAMTMAYITLLFAMPFSIFMTYSYPFFKASKEAYSTGSAILGESSLGEYAGASAISFEDRDVFPSYGVKVKSVKVYGDHRIDHVLYTTASLFIATGGPLADVLGVATRDLGHSEDVELLSVDDNGIEAAVDGYHIYAGKADYIRRMGIAPIVDSEDAAVENDGEVSIMYLTVDGEVAAKLYVQYVIDPDFEFVVKQLYKIGVCVGIKTFDPNIDDEMLSARLKLTKYPVRVLKCRGSDEVAEVMEHASSGIVSKGGAKSLLRTLSLCDKISHVTKTNVVLEVFSMILSVLIMGIILILGQAANIASLYVAVYQLFWIIPMTLITRIIIGKI